MPRDRTKMLWGLRPAEFARFQLPDWKHCPRVLPLPWIKWTSLHERVQIAFCSLALAVLQNWWERPCTNSHRAVPKWSNIHLVSCFFQQQKFQFSTCWTNSFWCTSWVWSPDHAVVQIHCRLILLNMLMLCPLNYIYTLYIIIVCLLDPAGRNRRHLARWNAAASGSKMNSSSLTKKRFGMLLINQRQANLANRQSTVCLPCLTYATLYALLEKHKSMIHLGGREYWPVWCIGALGWCQVSQTYKESGIDISALWCLDHSARCLKHFQNFHQTRHHRISPQACTYGWRFDRWISNLSKGRVVPLDQSQIMRRGPSSSNQNVVHTKPDVAFGKCSKLF